MRLVQLKNTQIGLCSLLHASLPLSWPRYSRSCTKLSEQVWLFSKWPDILAGSWSQKSPGRGWKSGRSIQSQAQETILSHWFRRHRQPSSFLHRMRKTCPAMSSWNLHQQSRQTGLSYLDQNPRGHLWEHWTDWRCARQCSLQRIDQLSSSRTAGFRILLLTQLSCQCPPTHSPLNLLPLSWWRGPTSVKNPNIDLNINPNINLC